MENRKIAALDAGADDYITKPFSAPELWRARFGAARNAPAAKMDLGGLRLDP